MLKHVMMSYGLCIAHLNSQLNKPMMHDCYCDGLSSCPARGAGRLRPPFMGVALQPTRAIPVVYSAPCVCDGAVVDMQSQQGELDVFPRTVAFTGQGYQVVLNIGATTPLHGSWERSLARRTTHMSFHANWPFH